MCGYRMTQISKNQVKAHFPRRSREQMKPESFTARFLDNRGLYRIGVKTSTNLSRFPLNSLCLPFEPHLITSKSHLDESSPYIPKAILSVGH